MRRRSAALALASVLCSALLLVAQTPSPSPTANANSAQALAVLQGALVALGGRSVLSDVTLTGNVQRIAGSDDESGTFTYKALRTGGNRYDFSFPSGARSEIRPPVTAGVEGTWSGPEGRSGPIANHDLIADPGIFPTFVVFGLDGLNPGQTFVVTFVGLETRNGLSVYHLSAYQQFPQMSDAAVMFAQHLTQTELYLDPATFLPVAIHFYTHPDDNALVDAPVELVFSSYRSVGGVQVPFHVQKYVNNSLVLDLQIQSAVFNSGLSASTFQVQ